MIIDENKGVIRIPLSGMTDEQLEAERTDLLTYELLIKEWCTEFPSKEPEDIRERERIISDMLLVIEILEEIKRGVATIALYQLTRGSAE